MTTKFNVGDVCTRVQCACGEGGIPIGAETTIINIEGDENGLIYETSAKVSPSKSVWPNYWVKECCLELKRQQIHVPPRDVYVSLNDMALALGLPKKQIAALLHSAGETPAGYFHGELIFGNEVLLMLLESQNNALMETHFGTFVDRMIQEERFSGSKFGREMLDPGEQPE